MNFLPARFQRWLAILLPPASLLVCCTVMVPRQNKLQDINKQIKATQANIQDYLKKLDAISGLPKDPRVATQPMTKQEQSEFLRGLSGLCTRTGNRLLTISSLAAPAPPPPPPPGSPPPVKPVGALPDDVVEIKSTIIFEGSFDSLRAFLAGIQRSQRLVSMTECRVQPGEAGYPTLQTTLTIMRYVDAPPGFNPAPAPAKAG